jgi:hypothetical protein
MEDKPAPTPAEFESLQRSGLALLSSIPESYGRVTCIMPYRNMLIVACRYGVLLVDPDRGVMRGLDAEHI